MSSAGPRPLIVRKTTHTSPASTHTHPPPSATHAPHSRPPPPHPPHHLHHLHHLTTSTSTAPRHILRVVALGAQLDGIPFVVIEKLQTTLRAELPPDADSTPIWVVWRERRKWPLERAVDCARQLASALAYCHSEALLDIRVLHRDIKPNNIGFMPLEEGGGGKRARGGAHLGRLVLFDFGIACMWRKVYPSIHSARERENDEVRPLTGECGSLRYMAPEVANSQPYNHKVPTTRCGSYPLAAFIDCSALACPACSLPAFVLCLPFCLALLPALF